MPIININNNKLIIQRFNPRMFCRNPNILIIGPLLSGKSVLCKRILKSLKYTNRENTVIISPKEEYEHHYENEYSHKNIHDHFEQDIIHNFVKNTKQNTIVFEDCLWNVNDNANKPLQKLFKNNKLKKTIIVTAQYATNMSTKIQNSFDYVFILKNGYMNQKLIFRKYAHCFPSLTSFRKTNDQFTTDYGCLVIDKTKNSNSLENIVFWYKSDHFKKSNSSIINRAHSWFFGKSKVRLKY